MTTLDQVIRFWKRTRLDFSFLMEPETRSMVELTIALLEELEKKRRGPQSTTP